MTKVISNGLRQEIQSIIEDHVFVERMVHEEGGYRFRYGGADVAAGHIMTLIYDRLESIDCE